MNTPEELARIRSALDLRRGGQACPWAWSATHSWFTLRIWTPSLAGNLHLRCGDCERVEFENRILDIAIVIEEIAPEITRGGWPSTACYRVRDGNRLLIECGILRIEYNVLPVFGLA